MARVTKSACCVLFMVVAGFMAACDPDGGGGGVNLGDVDIGPVKFITVTSPGQSDMWRWGETYDIIWSANSVEGKVRIHLLHDGSVVAELTPSAGTKNDGVYSWTVPHDLYDDVSFQIQVTSVQEPSVYGKSKRFMIRKFFYSFPTTGASGG